MSALGSWETQEIYKRHAATGTVELVVHDKVFWMVPRIRCVAGSLQDLSRTGARVTVWGGDELVQLFATRDVYLRVRSATGSRLLLPARLVRVVHHNDDELVLGLRFVMESAPMESRRQFFDWFQECTTLERRPLGAAALAHAAAGIPSEVVTPTATPVQESAVLRETVAA